MCWSPDGCYVVAGGEDDLITVWSFHHKRVVARGEGHQSYVTAVAFDPYTTVLPDSSAAVSLGNKEAVTLSPKGARTSGVESVSAASSPFLGRLTSEAGGREVVAYRLGSVGQDAQLCLWDLSEDALKIRRPFARSRSRPSRMMSQPQTMAESLAGVSLLKQKTNGQKTVDEEGEDTSTRPRSDALDQELHKPLMDAVAQDDSSPPTSSTAGSDHVQDAEQSHNSHSTQNYKPEEEEESKSRSGNPQEKEASPVGSEQSTEKETKKVKKEKDKGKKNKNGNRTQPRSLKHPVKRVMKFVGVGGHHNGRREVSVFETCKSDDIAPRMHEVNLIEPLVAERVDQERLSDLVFREDCIVVAGYDGLISLWARPGVESTVSDQTEAASGSDPPEPHPGVSLTNLNGLVFLVFVFVYV